MDVSGDISLGFLLPVFLYVSGKEERKDAKLFLFLVIMINAWLKKAKGGKIYIGSQL